MNTEKTCGCGRSDCDWNIGTCPREAAGELRRRRDAGGPRDTLIGKPLECGQQIDRLAGDVEAGLGRWVSVRYEARLTDDGPAFYVDAQGEHEITARDRFRWPLVTGPALTGGRAQPCRS